MYDRRLRNYKGRYTLNEENEVRIDNMVFSREDIMKMYIDEGMTTLDFCERFGIGRKKAYRILNKLNIPWSRKAKMSPRTAMVYRYIKRHKNKDMTLAEIGEGVGLTASTVYYHLQKIKEMEEENADKTSI